MFKIIEVTELTEEENREIIEEKIKYESQII